jgi:CubicO group peptidase (beta-lactamase class C family)
MFALQNFDMRKVATVLFALLFSVLTYAQLSGKQLSKKINELIEESYKSIAPGCVILLAQNNKIIYEKSFGTANLELKVLMQPEMVCRIGSITKQFTAVAILQLIEKGKIALNDSIQRFIPDFPNKGYSITIEHLLSHTSGIIGYDALNTGNRNVIRIDFPAKDIIDSIAPLPLDFVPGTKYTYSNSNYFLLGYIIEQVTHQTYQEYLRDNLFKPAGLSATYYDSPTEIIPNRVSGYTKHDNVFKNAGYISMSQVYSAGALLSNVEDLFRWHTALYSYKIIKKESLEKAVTPYRLSDGTLTEYGFGFFLKDINGIKSIGHGGSIDGFEAMAFYIPERDIYIAILFNSDSDDFIPLVENIADLANGKEAKISYKDLKLAPSILDRYIGKYELTEDTTKYISIYREGDRLYADLSNKTGTHMGLYAQSDTLFYVPVIKRINTHIEFIIETGEVKGLYSIQDKKYLFTKTK